MPSRVAVFAYTALLLACACAVLAAAGEQQQQQHHSLLSRLHNKHVKHTTTRRAHRRRVQQASVAATATMATATPTAAAPVDVLGTDWSKVDFKSAAPVTVTVRTDAVLYHASNVIVDFGKNPNNYQGYWLTPDLAQAIAGGVNKAKDARQSVFVHAYKPKRDLTLLALPACAKAGIAYLNSVVATKGVKPWLHTLMGNPSQFTGLHAWLDGACKVLATLGIDGWRSPWDQDEVMLCIAHQKELIEQSVHVCPFELLGPNVAKHTYWNPVTHTPPRFDAQVHAFAPDVCGTVDTAGKDLFSYESHVNWAVDLGQNAKVRWTARWLEAVAATAAERKVDKPTQHVHGLVARYRGQSVDANSFTWFCGVVPTQPQTKPQPKEEIKQPKAEIKQPIAEAPMKEGKAGKQF